MKALSHSEKEVNYKVKYLRETDTACFIHGGTYQCIAECFTWETNNPSTKKKDFLRVIDESGEDYMYGVSAFEKIED